jgi:hypothetical protein
MLLHKTVEGFIFKSNMFVAKDFELTLSSRVESSINKLVGV